MITVPQIVEEIVNRSPYLNDGLARELINISALAREIKPEVETQLMKRVSQASIIMALKRHAKHKPDYQGKKPSDYFDDLSIKSDLSGFSVENSPRISGQLASLQEEGWRKPAAHLTIAKGVWASTIVISNGLVPTLKKLLVGANYTYEYSDLTAITLRFRDEHHTTVGLIQYPLQLFAWRGISLYQIATTMDEVTFILSEKDVEHGFQALQPLI